MVSYLVVVNADDEPLSGVASDAEQQLLVVPVPPPSHCVRAPVIEKNEIKAKKKNQGRIQGGGKGGTCPPLEFRGQMPPPTILWANAPPPYF